jgi:hypothetical protein
MLRQLVTASSLSFGLVLVNLACAAPTDPGPGSPAAQATTIRRTAVAEVQAIIANKSTPTPVPEPTSTPTPSCPNAIWWTEARSHAGEARTVQGAVVGIRQAPAGSTLVEVGQAYPDPTGLSVVLTSGDATGLTGKTVCVAGRIGLEEGRVTLLVRDTSAFTVVD